MLRVIRTALVGLALAAAAEPGTAGELKLGFQNGRVTIVAEDVPVRQILAEWARVGDTRIVNAEKLIGAPVTLQLVNVPEGEALKTLLRSASGYMIAARATAAPAGSQFDRVLILATSTPIASAPTAGHPASSPGFVAQPPPNLTPSQPGMVTPPGMTPQPGIAQQPGVNDQDNGGDEDAGEADSELQRQRQMGGQPGQFVQPPGTTNPMRGQDRERPQPPPQPALRPGVIVSPQQPAQGGRMPGQVQKPPPSQPLL